MLAHPRLTKFLYPTLDSSARFIGVLTSRLYPLFVAFAWIDRIYAPTFVAFEWIDRLVVPLSVASASP